MTESPEDRERRLMEEFRAVDSGANIAFFVCIAALVVWSLLCFAAGWTIGGAV
jgi:hypothetical protein